VYDQYSQPVGYADFDGVYADPASAGELPRAMGPFSTTVTGLHGLPGFSIISPGDGETPITFGVSKPKWRSPVAVRSCSKLFAESYDSSI
jgi:hypothetical protein